MRRVYEFLRRAILPLEQINDAVPKRGNIVELGCGRGLISTYLSKVKTRHVTGIDIDPKSLPESLQENLKFIRANIKNYHFGNYQGVVVSDVLHHLSKTDQKVLIKKIAQNFKKGSVFVIKEIDTSEIIRSKLSRFWDLIFYPRDKISYWNFKDLKQFLTDLEFEVKVKRTSRFFPGSTTLFICTKR